MQPQALLAREVGRGGEVVHRPRVRGPGVGDQAEGLEARGAVPGDLLAQGVEAQSEALVGRHLAHAGGREAGHQGRLLHGVVRLVRRVGDAGEEVLGKALAPRRDQGDEVGQGAARREQPERLPRIAHHLAEPPADVGLDLREAGRGQPYAHEAVGGVGDEVGHRGMEQPAARDVGQVAGARGVEALGHGAIEEEVEQGLEGRPLLGQGLDERARQLGGAGHVRGGLAREGFDVGDDAVQRQPDQPPHLVRGELELGGAQGRSLRADATTIPPP